MVGGDERFGRSDVFFQIPGGLWFFQLRRLGWRIRRGIWIVLYNEVLACYCVEAVVGGL